MWKILSQRRHSLFSNKSKSESVIPESISTHLTKNSGLISISIQGSSRHRYTDPHIYGHSRNSWFAASWLHRLTQGVALWTIEEILNVIPDHRLIVDAACRRGLTTYIAKRNNQSVYLSFNRASRQSDSERLAPNASLPNPDDTSDILRGVRYQWNCITLNVEMDRFDNGDEELEKIDRSITAFFVSCFKYDAIALVLYYLEGLRALKVWTGMAVSIRYRVI